MTRIYKRVSEKDYNYFLNKFTLLTKIFGLKKFTYSQNIYKGLYDVIGVVERVDVKNIAENNWVKIAYIKNNSSYYILEDMKL